MVIIRAIGYGHSGQSKKHRGEDLPENPRLALIRALLSIKMAVMPFFVAPCPPPIRILFYTLLYPLVTKRLLKNLVRRCRPTATSILSES